MPFWRLFSQVKSQRKGKDTTLTRLTFINSTQKRSHWKEKGVWEIGRKASGDIKDGRKFKIKGARSGHWQCYRENSCVDRQSWSSRRLLSLSPWLPSVGFSRQEYWSGLPFPSPGDLPNPGIEPRSSALRADALPSEPQGKLLENRLLHLSKCLLCKAWGLRAATVDFNHK